LSGGCATSGEQSGGLARRLPPPPGFLAAVSVPDPTAGEDLRVVAARERAGRVEANRRLGALRVWYAGLRENYGASR
jgi:hypothetical protein